MKRIKKEKAKHRTGLIKRLTRDNARRRVTVGCVGIHYEDLAGMFKGGR